MEARADLEQREYQNVILTLTKVILRDTIVILQFRGDILRYLFVQLGESAATQVLQNTEMILYQVLGGM